MARSLLVYFNDIYAGRLMQDDRGRLSFTYAPQYLSLPRPIPFSVSMPLVETPYEDSIVRPFFSNLLPDDLARHRLARYLGLSEKNPFSLLESIGGDCAGALSLYPGNPPSFTVQQDPILLKEEELTKILKLLSERPLLAGEKNIRISLAGAQDKLAVVLIQGNVALAAGATPTSHIIKSPISDIPESVFNEYFCMALAKSLKLPVAYAEVRWAEGLPYLLLERYDRTPDHRMRLHQEDFCQALSIPPELKYESEGGPSLAQCFGLIENHSLRPGVDTLTFLRLVIFNYCIGNTDAHGKNFSFLYLEDVPELAPAYDLLSTEVYPQLSAKTAMKIGGKYQAEHVYLRHWHRLVPNTKLAQHMIEKELRKFALELPLRSLYLLTQFNSTGFKSLSMTKFIPLLESVVAIFRSISLLLSFIGSFVFHFCKNF